jgi:hypothetical protein
MKETRPIDQDTWKTVLRTAFSIFQDFEARGVGTPPFSMGGGTVLMLRWKHRLSKDIDFFGYDAQWISMLSPRLNDATNVLATKYVEQANGLKIVMPHGDIDFVVSGDVLRTVKREPFVFEGRTVELDPSAEILAKKMFYRAASFKARDVYDMSAALDLDPGAARLSIEAAAPRHDLLRRRLQTLSEVPEDQLLTEIVPYDRSLPHAKDMVRKVFGALGERSKALTKTTRTKPRTPNQGEGFER